MLSHVVVATGLTALGFAPSPVNMFAGWAIIGLCMGAGLYELGPATLAVVYGARAWADHRHIPDRGFREQGRIAPVRAHAGDLWLAGGLYWLGADPPLSRSAAQRLPAERGVVECTASTPTEDGPPHAGMALSLPTFVFAAHVDHGAETVSIPKRFRSVWRRLVASVPHMADA
jgi:hypothetical protein